MSTEGVAPPVALNSDVLLISPPCGRGLQLRREQVIAASVDIERPSQHRRIERVGDAQLAIGFGLDPRHADMP